MSASPQLPPRATRSPQPPPLLPERSAPSLETSLLRRVWQMVAAAGPGAAAAFLDDPGAHMSISVGLVSRSAESVRLALSILDKLSRDPRAARRINTDDALIEPLHAAAKNSEEAESRDLARKILRRIAADPVMTRERSIARSISRNPALAADAPRSIFGINTKRAKTILVHVVQPRLDYGHVRRDLEASLVRTPGIISFAMDMDTQRITLRLLPTVSIDDLLEAVVRTHIEPYRASHVDSAIGKETPMASLEHMDSGLELGSGAPTPANAQPHEKQAYRWDGIIVLRLVSKASSGEEFVVRTVRSPPEYAYSKEELEESDNDENVEERDAGESSDEDPYTRPADGYIYEDEEALNQDGDQSGSWIPWKSVVKKGSEPHDAHETSQQGSGWFGRILGRWI